jgi:menaquinone-dependent protoporphyrinogen oxidase
MKTIIIYATKYGFTQKCVENLKEKIKGPVDVVNIKEPVEIKLSEYNQVIIGGPIYIGKMQKEIKEFCDTHVETLRNKRVGLFITCGFLDNFSEHLKNSFPNRLLDVAMVKKCFGGEINITKMKFLDRLLTKMVIKMVAKEGKEPPKMLEENIDVFAKAMNIL